MNAAQSSVFLSLLAFAGTAIAGDVQTRLGLPVPGLDASQLARFSAGKTVFNHAFGEGEGRGPGFNDGACNGCHLSPAAGGSSSKFVTRFGVKATVNTPFDPLANLGGSLLQAEANDPVNCQEVVPPQANVTAHRITPPCFGFGLLEAIPDSALLANQNNPPSANVHGIAHMVQPLESPLGPQRVGRFGWKAQVATVLTFSGDASLNEMGLTNRLVPTENAPNGDQAKLAACDTTADPEDGPDAQGFDQIDRMTDFQRFLAGPPQTPKSGMTGETIFNAIGCADCHVSTFTTGIAPEVALTNKVVKPYSDFLLHDVGALGDGIVQGMGTETMFRTSPLWGLAFRAGNAMLHDGRASGQGSTDANLDMAIAEHGHGGEAVASANAYAALSASDKAQVRRFLLSLGQGEFDFEQDNDIDDFDWFFIQPFLTGPVATFTADDSRAINDVDQDGDFDLRDVAAFQRGFTGQ